MRRLMRQGNSALLGYLWMRLILLAGECGTTGELWLTDDEPYTAQTIAEDVELDVDFVTAALKQFIDFRMIGTTGEFFYIVGWKEHQSADELARQRELNRNRQQRHRDRKKNVENSDSNTAKTAQNGKRNAKKSGNVRGSVPKTENVTQNVTLRNATEEEKSREE